MTNEKLAQKLRDLYQTYQATGEISDRQAKIMLLAAKALEHKPSEVEVNIYDHEEIHENCTVQIWSNTVTGATSIGWWEN